MLEITKFTCENLSSGCVTDENSPRFSFALKSNRRGASLSRAVLSVNGWQTETAGQIGIAYQGPPLKPFTHYTATLAVEDDIGERAESTLGFSTGRRGESWNGIWITDGNYRFTEKKTSPIPMTFKRNFSCDKRIRSAVIYATAIGIYELSLNGKKVGEDYFAPGFTSYKHHLQYQTYDITQSMGRDNVLTAVVAGGWAVGAFVMTRTNRITAPRQAFWRKYASYTKTAVPR